MTSALILAAGFGTRLRPLTLELPKPVVPVGDRPLLAHVVAACRRAGASSLIANVHHEHAKITKIINDLSLGVEVVVEPEIRGTAGGVAGARARFEPGPVLVWNGDILTDAPVGELLELARRHDVMVLAVHPRPAHEGNVGLDARGAVVRLRGQVTGVEVKSADYVGVMALGPSVVAALPERGCLFAAVGMPHLARGGTVLTVPSPAPFSDLGDLREYCAANWAWLDAAQPRHGSWVGPGVAVPPGVALERCLLGAGATVSGQGVLREVIAWPGAPVRAPLSQAVVLGFGRVVSFIATAEN
jgi:mannose-1-phosphate guanylyltransferase